MGSEKEKAPLPRTRDAWMRGAGDMRRGRLRSDPESLRLLDDVIRVVQGCGDTGAVPAAE